MVSQIVSLPEARLLLMSLRSVGYTEETAIADIIDNSISADASEIRVQFDWSHRRIFIVDNGVGMDEDSLIQNMRIGSADPQAVRSEKDLGRFGMGMKTAAFSLGRKMTVVTKTNGVYANATWDLDEVPVIGWKLIIYEENEVSEFYPFLKEQGTIVIIDKLDRLIDDTNPEKSKSRFFKVIKRTHDHVSLTFHRFIEEDRISLYINGNYVEPWDPFLANNRATEELAEEVCYSEDGVHQVVIQPYILPHKTKFNSTEEFISAGGFKGWNYHQGVYVYRNKRLIVFGTWFDYIKKEPAYNLARIKLDISSSSDDLWNIDIKKSTAQLPLFVRDSVERVIDVATENSARVYNSRGTYSRSITVPNLSYVWEQRKVNGKYSFHINKKHTLLKSLRDKLDEGGQETLTAYLTLVENFAPFMVSGVTASLQSNQYSLDTDSVEYRTEVADLKKYLKLFIEQGYTKEEIRATFLEMPNYRHLADVITKMTEGDET